jgi:hypothetical protein
MAGDMGCGCGSFWTPSAQPAKMPSQEQQERERHVNKLSYVILNEHKKLDIFDSPSP